MTTASRVDVTQLLHAWGQGEKTALEKLMPLVYNDLRRRARRCMGRERPGHTLQTTALIHETYLRLVGSNPVSWENRAHFFGTAARAMRQVLVDHARRHLAQKRVVTGNVSRSPTISVSRPRRASRCWQYTMH